MGEAAELNEALNNDKAFKKARKVSERNLTSGKQIRGLSFEAVEGKTGSDRDVGGKSARVAMILVPLLLLAIYLGVAYFKGLSQSVYLLNGLTQAYQVTIDGESYDLQPNRIKRIELGEGQVEVGIESARYSLDSVEVTLASSFWSRPFKETIFVINPDRVAVLCWQNVYYVEKVEDAPEGSENYFVGESLYRFDGIDYPFRPYPETIDLPGGKPLSKERVSILAREPDFNEDHLALVVAAWAEPPVATAYFERRATLEPEDMNCLQMLYRMVDYDAFMVFMKPGLAARPVRIEWHRMYQETMDEKQPDLDLMAEYVQLQEQEPQNTALQYLVARISKDPKEAQRWYRQAMAGEPPSAYAYNGLAYQMLSNGEFREARELVKQAMELAPDHKTFRYNYMNILMAHRQYAAVLEHCRENLRKEPYDFDRMAEEVRLCYLLDGSAAAVGVIEGKSEPLRKHYLDDEAVSYVKGCLRAELAYLEGHVADYANFYRDSENPGEKFRAMLSVKEDIPAELLEAVGEDAYVYLLLYLAQMDKKNIPEAERFLARAIELLLASGYEERQFGKYLLKDASVHPEALCELSVDPKNKAMLLTAAGVARPEHKADLFRLARKLNYDRIFPYCFIHSILEEEK